MPEGARGRGVPQGGRRAPDPRGHPVRRLVPLFLHKNGNIQVKNRVENSAQSELRISGNLRNSERKESGTQKQRETERQIQSQRGSRPSTTMEAMDQRGNPSPM